MSTVQPPPVEYLTPQEAAAELGFVAETVTKWFDEGLLTGIRSPGGHRRIERASVEALKVSMKAPLPPKA